MNEPPNQSLQWIAASRRLLSFIVKLQCPLMVKSGRFLCWLVGDKRVRF